MATSNGLLQQCQTKYTHM